MTGGILPRMTPRLWWLLALLALGSAACADEAGEPAPPARPPAPVGVPPEGAADAPPEGAGPVDEAWVRGIHPDLTVLVVGNQRGKLKPCGCSEPQMGGLERLAALADLLRRRPGGDVVALSMGWSVASPAEPQAETKAALYRRALGVMGFDALLLGTPDLFVPAMAEPLEGGFRPAPPGNAPLSRDGPLAFASRESPLVEIPRADLEIRALTLLDPAHLARLGGVTIGVWPPDGVLGRLPPRPDALWIVSTDATGEAIESVETAMKRLGPTVIVDFGGGAGAEVVEDRPLEDGPFLVSLASFGKEVGVVDLVRQPDGAWHVSWHVVELLEKFETRYRSPSRDAVTSLFDAYRRVVRERDYLRRFETQPDDPRARYVGSARCAVCHPAIYDSWSDTGHAAALDTLREKGYAWDPECVRCHVVGFQRLTNGKWSRLASGFRDPERTPFLAGVGCESCHGPGSAHVQDPYDRSLWKAGGPNRREPGRRGCAVCHDVENSHGFEEHYEDTYLPAVDHRTVPADDRTVHPR